MKNKYLSLAQAARIAPASPSPNTVWRWCRKGVKARTGQRVYLKHIRVGGKIFIEGPALERFFKALSDADAVYFAESDSASSTVSDTDASRTRTPSRRAKDIASAESDLKAAGL